MNKIDRRNFLECLIVLGTTNALLLPIGLKQTENPCVDMYLKWKNTECFFDRLVYIRKLSKS